VLVFLLFAAARSLRAEEQIPSSFQEILLVAEDSSVTLPPLESPEVTLLEEPAAVPERILLEIRLYVFWYDVRSRDPFDVQSLSAERLLLSEASDE